MLAYLFENGIFMSSGFHELFLRLDKYSLSWEMSVKLKRESKHEHSDTNGYKIAEIPSTWEDRTAGESNF